MGIKKQHNLKAIKGNGCNNYKVAVHEITKLPLAVCRQTLNCGDVQYTDEEVLKIRDYLYRLAAIASEQIAIIESFEEIKVISLTEHKNKAYAQSDYLRTG